MLSIIAGFLIGFAAFLYLTIGGLPGAVMFSIGLLTILFFKLELFTGKAGLLIQKQINPIKLGAIWCGNWVGCHLIASLIRLNGLDQPIVEAASRVIFRRCENSFYWNIFLGIICGLLMYIAVSYYEKWPVITIMSVVAFVLAGANHCVADMFYLLLSGFSWQGFLIIIATTVGNIIGCNLIEFSLWLHRRIGW